MIYILSPSSGTYELETKNVNGEEKDMLVDKDQKAPDIPLQDLVKEALQHRKDRAPSFQKDETTIYYKKPPYDDNKYLKYIPQNNGKYPTQSKAIWLSGKKANGINSSSHTRYGQFWHDNIPLSAEKKKKIIEKKKEQRLNRRHEGNSPKAT